MSQSLLDSRHKENQDKPQRAGFRPDVQGLRALAVLVVISDHLFGYPLGGFVGVDVFFVISGFIITGMVLHEHDKSGRISLADFYRRRVRRILPVALVVLITTVLVAWFLFIGERALSVLLDALAASVFVANLRYSAMGTDYMQADGPVSPLQHFWSLSVEEQFYLVWPLVVIMALGISARRFGWRPVQAKKVLGVVLVVLIGASVFYAFWQTTSATTDAYFSTLSRAWELGLGALVAISVPFLSRVLRRVRPLIQWMGLLSIVLSLFIVTPDTAFPMPGAILPVIGTVMVLAGGIGTQNLMLPLTNRVSRYMGDISYSLYLWHFPVIVFYEAIVPSLDVWDYFCILVVIFTLSIASYEFVENPIRHSRWLDRRSSSARNQHNQNPLLPLRKQILGLALLSVAASGVVGAALVRTAPSEQAVPSAIVSSPAEETPLVVTPETALQAEISQALDASSWPVLNPALDSLGSKGFEKVDSEGCSPATPRGKDCNSLDAGTDKLAYIVGDSMGAAWAPTIRAALEPLGWEVQTMTYVGCPFLDADTVAADETITASCEGHKELVRSIIDETQPELVVVSNLYNLTLANGLSGDEALSSWETAALTARGEWLSRAEKVVTLASPPAGQDPGVCITRLAAPTDCTSSITPTWLAYAKVDERVSQQTGDLYLDKRSWFCATDQRCPVFVDDTIVRRDATHITAEYATKVAPLMAEALHPVLQ